MIYPKFLSGFLSGFIRKYLQSIKLKFASKSFLTLIVSYCFASLLSLFIHIQNYQKPSEISTNTLIAYNSDLVWLFISLVFWLNIIINIALNIYDKKFNLFFGLINLFFIFILYLLIFNEIFLK